MRAARVDLLLRITAGHDFAVFRFATLEAALTFAGRFGSDLMRVEAAGPAGRRDHRPRVTEVNYAASAHHLADILKPLKMTSSGFYVAEAAAGRIAEPQVDPSTGKRPVMPDVIGKWRIRRSRNGTATAIGSRSISAICSCTMASLWISRPISQASRGGKR